jgi:hypothetical protein
MRISGSSPCISLRRRGSPSATRYCRGVRSELLGTDLVPAQLLSPAPDDTSAFKEQFHAVTSSMQSSSGSRARKRRASRKLAALMVVVRGASLRDALGTR